MPAMDDKYKEHCNRQTVEDLKKEVEGASACAETKPLSVTTRKHC